MEKSKKQKVIIIASTVIILAVILGLYLGLPVEKRYNDLIFNNMSMDTYINVNIVNQTKIGDKLYNAVKYVDNLVNPTDEKSDIYRINHSKVDSEVIVDKMTINLIEISKDLYDKTGGKFNPAAYNLVDLWGFSAEKFNPTAEHVEPSQEEIDLGIKFADTFKDLKIIDENDTESEILEKKQDASFLINKVNNTIVRTSKCFIGENSAKLDLGGIAKGYAAELCYRVFEQSNAKNGLVNIAGNVYTFNKDWLVGIENPFKDHKLDDGTNETNIFGVATLNNLSVSCSGVYLRNYKIGDKFYHHIINTTTGRPQELSKDSIVMAGVIGNDGAVADAIATALVLFGTIDKAEEFIENNYKDEIQGVILINSSKKYKIIGDIQVHINADELIGFSELK